MLFKSSFQIPQYELTDWLRGLSASPKFGSLKLEIMQ